jgi:HK97 gp10 family phage protein
MARVRTHVKLDGEQELKHLLQELPRRVGKKALRQAVNAGAAPIVKAAKAAAPRESGLLKRSYNKVIRTYKSGNVVAVIGARREVVGSYRGKKRVPANYIHLVEKGTQPHRIQIKKGRFAGTTVEHPGARAQPHLEPAFERSIPQARSIMEAKLRDVVLAEAHKLGKR